MSQTPEDIVREDLNSLYIGNLNTVDADLALPAEGALGSRLTWTTSDARFIDPEGKVHRPLFGMGSRKVWLTCTAVFPGTNACGGAAAQRVFEANVLQEKREDRVTRILPVLVSSAADEAVRLPSVVIVFCDDGRKMTMPVTWKPDPEGGRLDAEGHYLLTFTGTVDGTSVPAEATAWIDMDPAPAPAAEQPKVHFYPMSQVRLTRGTEYYRAQRRMNEYLLSVDDDTMLFNFRKACGLDTLGADPMTGWDAEDCKLKGHTTGHYLSGLALAYAATGEDAFLQKIRYMIDSLAACRDAFAASGRTKPGFLSAYDETQFDLLEKFTKYPEIWAPYYTYEKIMSGLYDVYTCTGYPLALELLRGMGDWAYNRLSAVPEHDRRKMWSMYIAGEYGGMIGVLAKLYRLTGEARYLTAAGYFYNDKLFYPMEQGVDTLEDMHGNQHIPQIMGALELRLATGDPVYGRIGRSFWEMVTGHHIYCMGGTGETEMFHAPDSECRYLTDKAAESCASYNMERVTGLLFGFEPQGRLMDYYENTLLNHTLASCSKLADGGTTYFMPLNPGGIREYDNAENTCCHGTGLESRYRYMEHIYGEDDSYIYVNLYVESILDRVLRLSADEDGHIMIKARADHQKPLKLRIPGWAVEQFSCSADGTLEDGFYTLKMPLREDEEVTLSFPTELRILTNNSDPRYVNLAKGPYLMASENDSTAFITVQQAMKKLVRFHSVDGQAYHTYFLTE